MRRLGLDDQPSGRDPAILVSAPSLIRGAARGASMLATTVSAVVRHEVSELRLRKPSGAPERAAVAMQDWARRIAKSHDFAVHATGRVPARGDGALVVSNHVSYLEVIALAATFPSTFLGMVEIASWPVIGPAARVAGMVFVERGSGMSGAGALRRITRLLRQGVNVVAFPEGRTSDGTFVRRFSPALFRLAAAARRPIVPVAIRYDDPALVWTGDAAFVPHYAKVAQRPSSGVHLTFLPWLMPPPGSVPAPTGPASPVYKDGVQAAQAARAAIAETLGATLYEEDTP